MRTKSKPSERDWRIEKKKQTVRKRLQNVENKEQTARKRLENKDRSKEMTEL